MVSPGNNSTARFLNTALFSGPFWKVALNFLVAFASVLLELYAGLPVTWGDEIISCLLFCYFWWCHNLKTYSIKTYSIKKYTLRQENVEHKRNKTKLKKSAFTLGLFFCVS